MTLTRRDIVETSIELLNAEGVEGLSMRSIAAASGVQVAALYNHVANKRELYAAIAEHLCLSYELPASLPKNPTQKRVNAYLADFCCAYRALLLSVRDAPVIFEQSSPATPQRIEIIRQMIDALTAAGVSQVNMLTVSNMVNNYVLSFVADEQRFKAVDPDDLARFTELTTTGKLPLITDHRAHSFDDQFALGLNIILTGIAATTT